MSARLIAPFLLALSLTTPGCSSGASCDVPTCDDGVAVYLNGLVPSVTNSLPVTLDVCLDTTCSSFLLQSTGASAPPSCTDQGNQSVECSIDGEGNLVLTKLQLPDGTAGGATLSVEAKVTNGSGGTLFDMTSQVPLSGGGSSGACPACVTGQAIFTLQ